MYDDDAKKLGVKAIAKVESNNDYAAINYNDPITVGVVQWFGNRAANILNKMKIANVSGTWGGVAASLDNALQTVDQNSNWWNSRYLTTFEGNSIIPVLSASVAIQNEQIVADFEVYKDVAISYGFDPDTNTDTVLFFFTMHHQSPNSALKVIFTLDTEATLDEIYAASQDQSIVDNVFWQYPERYLEARDIIAAHDSSGIELPGEPLPEVPPVVGGGDEPGTANTLKNLVYAESVGSSILLHFSDSEPITLYAATGQRFIPANSTIADTEPPPVDPEPPVDPPEPSGDWVHPLPTGIITSPFGPRSLDGFHYGVDLSTPGYGGIDYAVTDMVIDFAGERGNGSAGTHVKGHSVDNAYTFCYYHMVYGSLKVRTGDTVTAGTPIGTEGATGNVFGRHTHFEVYEGVLDDPWPPPYGPMPIDPVALLRSKGVNI